ATFCSASAIDYAGNSAINSEIATENATEAETQQQCQYSLSSYSGTIDAFGKTGYFQVILSCAQEVDTNWTVFVTIDGNVVASDIVAVAKGQTKSTSVYIGVGKEYSGKSYRLGF
ncbi:MAG: hypothetical protein K2H61_00140, partial [Muribaculaceae bacterium]|nr:hypothetical protein [Muribaculaceae bacterium]